MSPSDQDAMFKAIVHGDQNDYCMTAGTPSFAGEGNDSSKNEFGMFPGHCYSLLAAYEIGNLRLVEMRNPHGTGEWTGAYSDGDSNWTQELKTKLNVQEKDDGTFYMPYSDFLEQFEECQIAKIHDDYRYTSLKVKASYDKDNYFRV